MGTIELSADPAEFGGNPILRVPVLRDGPHWVIESDQIVRHLLETCDHGSDRFAFFSWLERNAATIWPEAEFSYLDIARPAPGF